MKYNGNKKLTQNLFKNKSNLVNWCGVDYDGLLRFGNAYNPRYTWGGERWRGFEQIGDAIKDSGYKALKSLKRDES